MLSSIPSRFHKIVISLSRRFEYIEDLPWTLSHGDLTPSNVLVCPKTGRIIGLLDWAEAEFLPFGVGIYGLEELLGEDTTEGFTYYPEARKLRALFWSELLSLIPELGENVDLLKTVKAAQIFGILLWHGIAFDDGRLDRVVEEGMDDGEIQRLDAFLFHPRGPLGRRRLLGRVQSASTRVYNRVFSKGSRR
ncbi:hypothetical protein JX265_002690 [Neoarthrinium moseri]|uniref:non-specific serine/threonine protein kinase n=1 Tax=Neoarthrinium moseri TaxID=1658444 RepID=A0A9P9WUZ5_9PEZI|nr:hypothetical protein JX265_002690 [Neoarthrinium moseri]